MRRTDNLWSNDYDDFDNMNDAAKEWRALHYTPLEIIRHCRDIAERMLEKRDDKYPEHVLRYIIAECDGWTESYQEFNEV